jgi:hypothetical protein
MKKTFILGAVISTILVAVPVSVFAQTAATLSGGITTFATLIQTFTSSVGKAVATLLLSLALIAFFWGIVMYIWGAREGDSAKVEKGNTFLKWSLVALFVMFSVYGIIRFGQQFLCGQSGCDQTITIPDINFKTGASASSGLGGGSPSSGTSGLGNGGATGGTSGLGGGATLIQETNGWKYYSDGTAIGPDGTYYYQGQAVTGANGQGQAGVAPDSDAAICASISNSQDCSSMGCSWSNSELSCSL